MDAADSGWVTAAPKRNAKKAEMKKAISTLVSPDARALTPREKPRRSVKKFTRPRRKGERFDPRSPKGRRHTIGITSTHPRRVCEANPDVRGTLIEKLRSLETVLQLCADDIETRASDAAVPKPMSSYDARSHAIAVSRFYQLYDRVLEMAKKAAKTMNVEEYLYALATYLQKVEQNVPHLTRELAEPVPFSLMG